MICICEFQGTFFSGCSCRETSIRITSFSTSSGLRCNERVPHRNATAHTPAPGRLKHDIALAPWPFPALQLRTTDLVLLAAAILVVRVQPLLLLHVYNELKLHG